MEMRGIFHKKVPPNVKKGLLFSFEDSILVASGAKWKKKEQNGAR